MAACARLMRQVWQASAWLASTSTSATLPWTCVAAAQVTARYWYGVQGQRRVSTEVSAGAESEVKADNPPVKLSKAMKAYQERAQAHEAFMFEQQSEYDIGRRHLANIMGEDPETFTQDDVDAAIRYLLPSGLFEPRARPHMKPPSEVFAKRKDAEFDQAGRPHHTLFYTGTPSFYQVMHDLSGVVKDLDRFEDRMKHYSVHRQDQDISLNLASSEWVTKEELENILLENLNDKNYEFFLESMQRLVTHPYSYRASDFIMRFRKPVKSVLAKEELPKLQYNAEGRPYNAAKGKRKSSQASVTIYGRGSGQVSINGNTIMYFKTIQCREQIIFPLQFTDLLGKVDLVADVEGGGSSGQAGAIRYALSQALMAFVDREMVDKMRLAGLLTQDPRRRERKKPGQKGARAKFTWKKR